MDTKDISRPVLAFADKPTGVLYEEPVALVLTEEPEMGQPLPG